ncbi:glutaredoxin family protein [Raineyella fluvialis]|uniref:glutaredoxin family protein n=1 Tax=Raineyella fluvialis TaxID=2662261 RepID=UPI001E30B54A|nr:glutaredoxin family protein [Raineyella fluvialis]
MRVLSRVGCHLCDDLLVVVDEVCRRRQEAYDVTDVDDDPALRARYGDLVPVVFVDGAQFATWRVDAAALDAALSQPRQGVR